MHGDKERKKKTNKMEISLLVSSNSRKLSRSSGVDLAIIARAMYSVNCRLIALLYFGTKWGKLLGWVGGQSPDLTSIISRRCVLVQRLPTTCTGASRLPTLTKNSS